MRNAAPHLGVLNDYSRNGTELVCLLSQEPSGRRSTMRMMTSMHMLDDEVNEAKRIAAGFFTNCGWKIEFWCDKKRVFIAGSMAEFVREIDDWHMPF